MYAVINIGSNLGNRRLNISKAVSMIEKKIGYFELSHTFETHPWGYVSDKLFLNTGMAFHTDMSPEQLLTFLQEIERLLNKTPHRDSDGNYSDREIDIDIMILDDRVIDTEELKVPHPHLAERDFFLLPLEELVPGWRHPLTGLTPAEMLSNIEKVKKTEQ